MLNKWLNISQNASWWSLIIQELTIVLCKKDFLWSKWFGDCKFYFALGVLKEHFCSNGYKNVYNLKAYV